MRHVRAHTPCRVLCLRQQVRPACGVDTPRSDCGRGRQHEPAGRAGKVCGPAHDPRLSDTARPCHDRPAGGLADVLARDPERPPPARALFDDGAGGHALAVALDDAYAADRRGHYAPYVPPTAQTNRAEKIHSVFEFPLSIYMDRYLLDNRESTVELRIEESRLRQRLADLTKDLAAYERFNVRLDIVFR